MLIVSVAITFYVSSEPEIVQMTEESKKPVGYHTTKATINILDTLLNKKGGYISNDIAPPYALLDDMPSWEYGVLSQLRDVSLSFRNHLSRSQSQSIEDKNLVEFQTFLSIDSTKWWLPSSESQYKKGKKHLQNYFSQLQDGNPETGVFYARADNLVAMLKLMNKRLGSLSQRLSASIGQIRKNTDLSGDAAAKQAKDSGSYVTTKTDWLEIDDIFYEARGSTWALIAILKGVRIDFDSVLKDKNATRSVDQIINELETTQRNVTSLMILNGSEFGLVPNYSIAMSSYVTRANAGIIDLISLLENG